MHAAAHRGLCEHWKSVSTESWSQEKKSFVPTGNWIHDSTAPGISVWCSTNWPVLPLKMFAFLLVLHTLGTGNWTHDSIAPGISVWCSSFYQLTCSTPKYVCLSVSVTYIYRYRELNPWQYCTRYFCLMFYQLTCSTPKDVCLSVSVTYIRYRHNEHQTCKSTPKVWHSHYYTIVQAELAVSTHGMRKWMHQTLLYPTDATEVYQVILYKEPILSWVHTTNPYTNIKHNIHVYIQRLKKKILKLVPLILHLLKMHMRLGTLATSTTPSNLSMPD